MGGFTCVYGLGVAPDGLNVYVSDDCLYTVTNFRRDPDTGSLAFEDELIGDPRNGDGLGCLKSLSFTADGVRDCVRTKRRVKPAQTCIIRSRTNAT